MRDKLFYQLLATISNVVISACLIALWYLWITPLLLGGKGGYTPLFVCTIFPAILSGLGMYRASSSLIGAFVATILVTIAILLASLFVVENVAGG
jgi:hypothetical protein